jgi:outer membrane protein insertion porin family
LIKFLIIFFFILTNSSFSEIKKVNIIGNSRVNSNTIEALVDKKTINIDSIFINSLTKKLFDTDFFSDVKINYNQEIITINVSENPIVNFFYVNGIKDTDLLDDINKIIILKENSIFSSSKLKKDIEAVKDFLNTRGYYQASVSPEVIKIENNQVNLIINIDKKEISKISNIYFIGDKFFSSSQLLDVISSTENTWWKLFSSTPFTEQRIDYDKQSLKDFYKAKGFYDIQIESVFANLDKNNNFSITFSINSGKKYKFGEIEIKSSKSLFKEYDLVEIKNISNELLFNEFYSPLTINKLNTKITSYIESKKYNNIEVIFQEAKKDDGRINILLEFNNEQKTLVNKINIFGNTITADKTIRNNTTISEGDYLNLSKVKKSIDNLKSRQLFSKVDYKIEDIDKKNFKDFNIFVKEQPTGSIGAGVGYGTNGGLFEASINERNFLGKGVNLNFTGNFSSDKISGIFSYADPNFYDSDKELVYSLFSQKDDYKNSGYENKKVGTKFATKYDVYDNIFFKPSVGIQYDELATNNYASSLLRSRQGDFLTTSFGYNLSMDLRDSRFNPTSGSIVYFDQNIATLFSDIPTIETEFGTTLYKELLSEKFIGSAKIKIANATAFNDKDIKLSDRIYAYQGDLRGFETRGVGPIDSSGDHIGGNNLAILSLKSTFPNPIPDNFRANSYLFFDMGNVWGVDYSDIISDSSKFRLSTGAALDITTPIGPISFSYSIPLSKASTDKEQKFLFNIGSSF